MTYHLRGLFGETVQLLQLFKEVHRDIPLRVRFCDAASASASDRSALRSIDRPFAGDAGDDRRRRQEAKEEDVIRDASARERRERVVFSPLLCGHTDRGSYGSS